MCNFCDCNQSDLNRKISGMNREKQAIVLSKHLTDSNKLEKNYLAKMQVLN